MSVYILTGASRGIGLSIAKILLQKDVHVVGVSRSSCDLKHENFSYVAGDLSEESTVTEVIKVANSKGKIRGLVLNAGVLDPVSKLADANIAEWKKLYDINVFSIVGLLSKAIPYLRDGGRVVAVSSGASIASYPAWGAYGSSKAALNHIIQTLSVEEPTIFSVSIAPGVVDTGMQNNIRDNHGQAMGDVHRKFMDLHETGGLLKPEVPGAVIANLVLEAKGDFNGKYLRYNDEQLKAYA